jgi:hypothetical protein
VWSWSGEAPASHARPADVAEAHEWIRAHRAAPEPWQRDDPSLVRMSPTHAFRTEGGAVLVRSGSGRASVLQIAAETVDDAADLLAAARALGALHLVNVPEGDPASAALARLGGALDLRQHELVLGRVPACSTT